ncbi:MAG TPA: hypothetical protein VK837_00205 [Longimicrobiales bacterium]|nr:hypothetical protein [Longimicrobiales bacterium]
MRPVALPALLALTFLAAPAGAAAQDYTEAPGGALLDPPPRVAGDPLAACATPAALPPGSVETGCDVVEALDLGTATESWLVRYHRTAEVPEGGATAVVEIEEFAVLEAAGSGYRAVWHLPVDLRFQSLSAGEVAGVDGATVLAYWLCYRGTGGCAQQFLIRDGGGWGIVDQPYLGALAGLAPEGWTLHEGREIDLRSLSGQQPLLGPEDPNASPSGVIRFTVALRGRALELADATVDVPEPEPEAAADSTADPPRSRP